MKHALAYFVAVCAALSTPAAAQTFFAQDTGRVLQCGSSDGVILLDRGHVLLRDYVLHRVSFDPQGVALYADPRSGATAELDERNGEALHLAISEGGMTMRVLLPRTAITAVELPPTEPVSPLMREGSVGASFAGEATPDAAAFAGR
jgi:hypothetical protein